MLVISFVPKSGNNLKWRRIKLSVKIINYLLNYKSAFKGMVIEMRIV